MNKEGIRRFEELSMNAWPAIRTELDDGWVLRFADGYTKRSNSINPIYEGAERLPLKVLRCEKRYQDMDLPVVFKLSEGLGDGLDTWLEEQGYGQSGESWVMAMPVRSMLDPTVHCITVENRMTTEWLETFSRFSEMSPRHRQVFIRMMSVHSGQTRFHTVMEDDRVVACGLGVHEDGHYGLFDIIVDPEQRGKGWGRRLITCMIRDAYQAECRQVYLQVENSNTAALSLYETMGFEKIYRYWYRVKPFE